MWNVVPPAPERMPPLCTVTGPPMLPEPNRVGAVTGDAHRGLAERAAMFNAPAATMVLPV